MARVQLLKTHVVFDRYVPEDAAVHEAPCLGPAAARFGKVDERGIQTLLRLRRCLRSPVGIEGPGGPPLGERAFLQDPVEYDKPDHRTNERGHGRKLRRSAWHSSRRFLESARHV